MLRILPLTLLATFAAFVLSAETAAAQVIIVQPQPAPRTKVVVVKERPVPRPVVVVQEPPQRRKPRQRKVGIHGHVGGIVGDKVDGNITAIGGGTIALRIRPKEHFALDFGVGAYRGHDHDNLDRFEVPLTLDLLYFVNPQHMVQFYLLAGGGGVFTETQDEFGIIDNHAYVAGEAGLGIEIRLAKAFALSTDARIFLRHRVSDGPPEFVHADGRTTNTSAGGIFTVGATLYF